MFKFTCESLQHLLQLLSQARRFVIGGTCCDPCLGGIFFLSDHVSSKQLQLATVMHYMLVT